MTRDPARIDPILARLRGAWIKQLVPSTLPTNPESSTDDEPDLFA